MTLADSSVWIAHFRRANPGLQEELSCGRIGLHEFVIGELAAGSIPRRHETLSHLGTLPRVPAASHEDAMALLERRSLQNSGLGWIDVHLLASSLIAHVPLWTLDKRLAAAARSLGIAARLSG